MYLRTLIGPYAGQVLDFSPQAASAMLSDGRAEYPETAFADGGVVEEPPTPLVGETVQDHLLPASVAAKVSRRGKP